MKKRLVNYLKAVFAILLLFAISMSCNKDEKNQSTFEDVFDISGFVELNQHIMESSSMEDVANAFEGVDLFIPPKLKVEKIAEVILDLETNLEVSNSSRNKLIKNDINAYVDVLEKIGHYAKYAKNDLQLNFDELKKSKLNKYCIKVTEVPDDFYSDDYYASVVAFQDFMKNEIVAPLKKIQALKAEKSALIGAEAADDETTIATYILIVSNNNWDMWWTISQSGKKIKHKGSSGSFPG